MEQSEKQFVADLISEKGKAESSILEILYAVQNHFGYLPIHILEEICKVTDITASQITGVSSFYDIFRFTPAGEYNINVCVGTACHVKGAAGVYDAFKRYLDIGLDDDTDSERRFTVRKVACLGCCTLAPAVQIDEVTYGHVTPDTIGEVIDNFIRYQSRSKKSKGTDNKRAISGQKQGEVRIGLGSCCVARGSEKIRQAILDTLAHTEINVQIKHVGCVGMCSQTPLLEIVDCQGENFLYTRVNPEDVKPVLLRHFEPASLIKKFLNKTSLFIDRVFTDNLDENIARYPVDYRDPVISDFLSEQKHIATENCGIADPLSMDEYRESGGFEALEKCVKHLDISEIIEQIKISGLRGRGGGGFATHKKWSSFKASEDSVKYLVCNGDEGDPGAFMDRMLMESYPFRVLEGIIIAGYTINATHGYFYIRAEYPLASSRIRQAIIKCRQSNLLGKNILGSGYDFDITIVPGAGAFVCGEETALLSSIEGKRGTPRLRPPYPSERGLWGRPTLINNVETYASVPWIIRSGADNYSELGSENSKGTKVFALAGKVNNGGLIEVPMGITIKQIVEHIGGGIANGLKFKAVQVGGPSGGCIPAALSDIKIDYESLNQAGAIMGSGGLVVLDETDCMVDIARYFLEFTQDQSCGKCAPCRVGTRRMLEILNRLCTGQGKKGDVEELLDLAEYIKQASLCGLGKTAPNPVMSTIQHFREEYEAHIEGNCPAKRCRSLVHYSICDKCIGCTICATHCPVDAIEARPYERHEIDDEKCIRCGTCKTVCPEDAVEVE
jgi:NADH-quinone oxidoreductase subunit F